MEKKVFVSSRKLHVNLSKEKKRKNSSAIWLQRQLNDQFVEASKKQGYRSRAAFKLIEINDQFQILEKNQLILELGAAPGSWTQVCSDLTYNNAKSNKHNITAIDLINIDPVPGSNFIQGDIYKEETLAAITDISFDLILSDMAPNTSGHGATDHLRMMALADRVFELCFDKLNTNGSLVIKIFQGSEDVLYINNLRNHFSFVKRFKPDSSRKESKEIYIIAKGFSKDGKK